MSKPLFTVLLTTAIMTLAGCQSRPTTVQLPLDTPTRSAFTAQMQQALQRSLAMAQTGEQIGAVTLEVTLDRRYAPTACKVRKSPQQYQSLLPPGVLPSNYQALAKLVEEQCWKTIYPVVPVALYGGDDTVEVHAPLIVVLPRAVQAPGSPRHSANAQRQFFWQHLLRDQAVTSVGLASVYYRADAQGKVEGCLVQLYPNPLRTDAFRLDGHLQAQLNSRCMALDLRQMPGFTLDEHGKAEGYSELDYAPWRAGRE